MTRYFNPAEPELMDRPQPVSVELTKDLENLASLNRWFGSHRLLRKFLRRWWGKGDRPRVLDLCCGAGDLPQVMCEFARARGIMPQITALDANAATVEIARQRCAEFPEIEFVQGDALTFEPRERDTPVRAVFDMVHCSLALHHFSEADAIQLLRHCRTLGVRILISDLERGWFTSAGVWLLTSLIYREPMTKHDGRESARRAFSYAELRDLAREAGWQNFRQARFAFCRQAIWLE